MAPTNSKLNSEAINLRDFTIPLGEIAAGVGHAVRNAIRADVGSIAVQLEIEDRGSKAQAKVSVRNDQTPGQPSHGIRLLPYARDERLVNSWRPAQQAEDKSRTAMTSALQSIKEQRISQIVNQVLPTAVENAAASAMIRAVS